MDRIWRPYFRWHTAALFFWHVTAISYPLADKRETISVIRHRQIFFIVLQLALLALQGAFNDQSFVSSSVCRCCLVISVKLHLMHWCKLDINRLRRSLGGWFYLKSHSTQKTICSKWASTETKPVIFFNHSIDTHYSITAVIEVTVTEPLHCSQLSTTYTSLTLPEKQETKQNKT